MIVSEEGRLDAVIAAFVTDRSRAQIKRAIDEGLISVNGAVCTKASLKVKAGDSIEWELPQSVDLSHPAGEEGIAFTILFEDEYLYVIDKPAGLVVHPGAGHLEGTLVNGLLARYPDLAKVGEPDRPGIVHRLDAETSGLLLVAKRQDAYEKLTEMFARHDVHRQYWAICLAPKLPDSGRFDTPYGRHPTQRIKYSSKFESEKRAVTDYRVIERTEKGFALVTCRLHTGRTHQVRVHLSDHHSPILSDPLYAPSPLAHHKAMSRLALHAGKLVFEHPMTHENMTFISPIPADFSRALDVLGLHLPY